MNERHLQAHPWHGITPGEDIEKMVNVFIEMVPADTVKYEVDKKTGHMMLDRPQKYSNLCPCPYGFIPQTLCAEKVAQRAQNVLGKEDIEGDDDPIDICVLTERAINHGGILAQARPIGGFRMIDGNEADDKIIAILKDDPAYGDYTDIGQVPVALLNRIRHYFLTYKQNPDTPDIVPCEIAEVYGADEAVKVIQASIEDYKASFPE